MPGKPAGTGGGRCAVVPTRLAPGRDRIVAEWFAATLATYPAASGVFLRDLHDRFRNPVGHALREGLSCLVDELLGEFHGPRVVTAMDAIVRVRAVQDFTPGAAMAFVGFARAAARAALGPAGEAESPGDLAAFDARVAELERVAADRYAACQDRMRAIQAGEASRRRWVQDRIERRRAGRDHATRRDGRRASGEPA